MPAMMDKNHYSERMENFADSPTRKEPGAHYLDGLNPQQKETVLATEGPVLVLAGAGTGKTRALTARIAHILAEKLAWPSQILAVTFTNKAGREMKSRITEMIGPTAEGMPWLGTFHTISAKILRFHAPLVGLKSSFTILGRDDQLRVFKQILSAANIDEKRWPAKSLASLIDRWKNQALTPEKVPPEQAISTFDGKNAIRLYHQYQDRLLQLNAADFGDLLLSCITLFQKNPDILTRFHQQFRYILVDEYQDTNIAQYLWLRLLAQRTMNLCCVGDDDQSIYGWRGAEIGNILRFEKDFAKAKIIRLERNYRSTTMILEAAGQLIAANHSRLGKALWTKDNPGQKIPVHALRDSEEEARFVADQVNHLCARGRKISQMAILVRASSQFRAFEERFLTIGLAYQVIGGVRFYERAEIRDSLAYLQIAYAPDSDLSFERIFNQPKRGLGNVAMRIIQEIARQEQISLYAASEIATRKNDAMRSGARQKLAGFLQDIHRWHENARTMRHTELAEMILDESGYTTMLQNEMLQNDKREQAAGRLDNLKELIRAMAGFENLAGFLDHVALVMELENTRKGEEALCLMTMHAAKGLEFDAVFLPGWEEGLFPSIHAINDRGQKGIEEERRLAYVGLTRAKNYVYISHVANRRWYNGWQASIPSRFLQELPATHIEAIHDMGYASTYGFVRKRNHAAYGHSGRKMDFLKSGQGNTLAYGQHPKTALFVSPQQNIAASFGQAKDKIKMIPEEARHGYDFCRAMQVIHDHFGQGVIVNMEGSRLKIDFGAQGTKTILADFVRPAGTKPHFP